MSSSSLSSNPPPLPDEEVSVVKKDDEDAMPQLLQSPLPARHPPGTLPALPPPPRVVQVMNTAVAPPSSIQPSLVGGANYAAVPAPLVTALRGSDEDVARRSLPSVKREGEAPSSSSTLGDLRGAPVIPVPGNVSSVALPPVGSLQQHTPTTTDLGVLPGKVSVTSSCVHSPPSTSSVISVSLLVEKSTALSPPLQGTALPLPDLPPPPALSRASEPPDAEAPVRIPVSPFPTTAAAVETPSRVAERHSMDTTTSSATEKLPYAVTSLLPVTSSSASVLPACPLQKPTAVTAKPSPSTESQSQNTHTKRETTEEAVLEVISASKPPENLAACCTPTSSWERITDRSSGGGGSVCVRRTRGIGYTHIAKKRRQRRSGRNLETAAKLVSSCRRRKTHPSGGAPLKAQRSTVVRVIEANGGHELAPSSGLQGTASSALQSPSAPAPDGDTKPKRRVHRNRTNWSTRRAAVRDAAGMNGAPPAALAGSIASQTVDGGSDIPLLFTSPAARLQATYQNSTKNKGLTKTEIHQLTKGVLLGGTDTGRRRETDRRSHGIGTNDEDGTDDTGGFCRERALQWRRTGAFTGVDEWAQSCQLGSSDTGGCQRRGCGESTTSSTLSAGCVSGERGGILILTIRGMSPLHADTSVVHPFVRAWVVSCASGRSQVQAPTSVPCAVTHPFDLRARKTRAPLWNAQLALRLNPEQMGPTANDSMLLLEVLDFGNESLHGFPLLRQGLYPICWGFLMLRDCAGRSNLLATDDLHVQLYRYPSRTAWYLSLLSALMPVSWSTAGAAVELVGSSETFCCDSGPKVSIANDVPAIHKVFANANNRKIPYEGCIVIGVRQTSNSAFVPDPTDMLLYEEYLLSMLVSGGGSSAAPRSSRCVPDRTGDDMSLGGMMGEGGVREAAVPPGLWSTIVPSENFYRMDGERSLLPHEILQTTAVLGVVTCVSFAHRGSFAAFGVCRHLQHVVELRNPLLPHMAVVACLVGHTGHIHRIVFQKEDNYLLSCSSDGTVRVWQLPSLDGVLTPDLCEGSDSMQCVCTLPHGFPVYTAVFHQDKIIASGFSEQLFVWDYDHTIQGEVESVVSLEGTALGLMTTFSPAHHRRAQSTDSQHTTGTTIGQLIQRVDTAGVTTAGDCAPTTTLSLASNERSNRVWSVHTNGSVVCWRATIENAECSKDDSLWQMSPRHTADCSGSAEVQVKGAYAIVTCGSAPVVFIFDATTGEQLRVVNTRLSCAAPIHLLPDGEAFVAAIGDPGRLLAWECFDGGLCTPATGYGKASPLFSIARMAWAESQQLAIFVSHSPSSEGEMARYTQGPMMRAAGQSVAAFQYLQQEQKYRQSDIPAEVTLITVSGTVRSKSTVLLTADSHSSEAFVTMFGGDLQPKRKAAYLAARARAVHRRADDRASRNARLHPTSPSSDPSGPLANSVAANVPYDATENGARMNAIINFWRGLVSQHRRRVAQPEEADRTASSADAFGTHPAAWRAMQYVEDVEDSI
ncbi:hypothetical protein, conserved [Leishmania tarentolae]|uniref:Guanine nucleotide-binding protein subunit beta-like protein n=1 Tax=Leishmania tarentolae TaxID=5689 RepID=A0A640KPA1_LEITA|nr:hypothetical protein, conserved [Leishmania tarentolae]